MIFFGLKGEWTKALNFDTRQYNHIIRETQADLSAIKLKNRITTTIRVKNEGHG